MNKRNRIFLGIMVSFVLGTGALLYAVTADLDIRYRESAEETLVDTAYLLAAWIETDTNDKLIDATRMRRVFDNAYRRTFEAHIYAITKHQVDLRAYVTDVNGIVVFDSLRRDEGQDFRAWHDVNMALGGLYGARTTRVEPDKPETAVMYVAAPIFDANEHIVGAVSVGKAVASQQALVSTARQKLFSVGLITMAAFLVLLLVLSVWLARPYLLVNDLLRVLRQEGPRHPLRLLRRSNAVLRAAFRDMRDALAGRSYTEEYVQALTHELKSPLTAIRSAAELLRDPMPEAQRQRFTESIQEQVQRLQNLAERLLDLAALEKRRVLEDPAPVDLRQLADEASRAMQTAAHRRNVVLEVRVPEHSLVQAEAFLLQQALTNLLSNAIDFSPEGGMITVSASREGRRILLEVRDHGPGIPEYALERVFEKFYSLRRPDSGHKSTGLGLPFVREIAHLHGGEAYLANHPEGGAVATLSVPAWLERR